MSREEETMSAKHTPGPWKILNSHQYENHSGAAQLIENPNVGAVCLMIDTDDGRVCDANARLIAAAPELVEALNRMLQTRDWGICRCAGVGTCAGCTARAALHKAGIE